MRKKLVVGNWKMNKTVSETVAAIQSLRSELGETMGVEAGICPPFTSLDAASRAAGDSLAIGAQDVFWKASGAFTGSISVGMLADLGCRFCIVGHSETRGRFGKLEVPESTLSYFAESDETVHLKIAALLARGITPILCVGETLSERESGGTDKIIRDQLQKALSGIEPAAFGAGVVAYEPVWAIGTGKVCDTPEAQRVCAMIRSALGEILNPDAAKTIRILYGGSVKPANAGELFAQPDIDGGLVGGASLDPSEFASVIRAAG